MLWDLFPDKFFVACFCFAAQFLWSLGFDIKLYTGVHDALMLSLALVFEAILAFVLAIKLLQHLPLQHDHINHSYHEVVLALVLAMKQYLHQSLQQNYTSTNFCMKVFHTCLCNVATLVVFSIKLHKHSPLPRSLINTHLCNEATAALFFSHKAGSTLHLHWSHANVCHEVASPLIFVMKLRQLLHLH